MRERERCSFLLVFPSAVCTCCGILDDVAVVKAVCVCKVEGGGGSGRERKGEMAS